MKLAICGETEAELSRLDEIAAALGAKPDRIAATPPVGDWPDRFSTALLAAEAEIAALAPDLVLVAGDGPAALASALAATRAVVPLARLKGEAAVPADQLAAVLIGAAEAPRQAAAALRQLATAPPGAAATT